MKKTGIKNHILNYLMILVITAAAGYLLLVLAYSLPLSRIRLSAANSIHIFQTEELTKTEGGDVLECLDYYNTSIDHYMDGEALNMAICDDGTSPFLQAVTVNKYLYEDMNPKDSLIHIVWGDEGYYIESYSRFWHGYLVILKPLMLFFSLADIRMINMFLQCGLMFILVWLLTKKNLGRMIPALLICWFFLTPSVMFKSIQYTTAFYVALAGSILLLVFYEPLRKRDLDPEFFFLLGTVTNYIILLTFPLLSLAIPLCIYIMFLGKENLSSKEITLKSFTGTFSWGLGYAFMWVLKWVISFIVMGPSSFQDVLDTFKIRAIGGEGAKDYTLPSMIMGNITRYERPIYLIILILATLAFVVFILYKKKKNTALELRTTLSFALLMIYPFIWYIIMASHSYVHAFFTHRNLCVTILAWFCLLGELTE